MLFSIHLGRIKLWGHANPHDWKVKELTFLRKKLLFLIPIHISTFIFIYNLASCIVSTYICIIKTDCFLGKNFPDEKK